MRLHVVGESVLAVEGGAADGARVLPADVVYPRVPDELVLAAEALVAAGALEGSHAGVRGHVPVEFALAHERFGTDGARVRPVARMHRVVEFEALAGGEALVAREAGVTFYLRVKENKLGFILRLRMVRTSGSEIDLWKLPCVSKRGKYISSLLFF